MINTIATLLTALTLTTPAMIRIPDGEGANPVIAQPVKRTRLEKHGRQYWRAVYQVFVNDREPPVDTIVVEWACDPVGADPGAICAAQFARALPGFDDSGRPNAFLVQLGVQHRFPSNLDGVPIYGASPHGSKVIAVEDPDHRAIPALRVARGCIRRPWMQLWSSMPSLTIRNITEDQLEWLRSKAKERGRSLNAEVLDLLAVARADELAASHPESPFARSLLRARALGVRTPSSSRRIVRSDRDRDDRR